MNLLMTIIVLQIHVIFLELIDGIKSKYLRVVFTNENYNTDLILGYNKLYCKGPLCRK